ncbi:MAG: hypothetical protein ABI839_08495 [Verrucomicrobiota bacterium]
MKSLLFSIVFACAVSAVSVLAQNPASDAQDRSQLFRSQPGAPSDTPPEETALGYAAPSSNDADLGTQAILKRQDSYKAWTVSFSAPYYWTSNVALARTGEVSDGVFAPLAGISYQPKIWKSLYGELGVAQQLFYYNRYSSFNFASFDTIAGLVYYLPQLNNLTLRLRYDFNRLTSDEFDEFFSNHQLVFMAELPYRVGRAMQVSVGGVVDISVAADHQDPRRKEFDGYVDYQVQLSRSFSVDASARVLLKDYYANDRTDVSEILALTANYRVRDWLSLSAVSTFAWNQSNESVFDYSVANLGGAVSANIKF